MNNHMRALRTERGWSQQHLGELLEVSRQPQSAAAPVATPLARDRAPATAASFPAEGEGPCQRAQAT